MVLSFDLKSLKWSDGKELLWSIGSNISIDFKSKIDKSYLDAIVLGYLRRNLNLWCPIVEPDEVKLLQIKAPVTVRKLFNELNKFYSRQLSTYDYDKLYQSKVWKDYGDMDTPGENIKTMRIFHQKIKNYGQLRGNHVYFESFELASKQQPLILGYWDIPNYDLKVDFGWLLTFGS